MKAATSSLRSGEVTAVLANLRRRFPKSRYPGLVSVGLGPAFRENKPDPDRKMAVRFFVRRKHVPEDVAHHLPTGDEKVNVRVKRGGRWVTLQLPTDVVSLAPVTPTGLPLRMPDIINGVFERNPCTGGVWVEWFVDDPNDPTAHGAFLTVGHTTKFSGQFTTQQQMTPIDGNSAAGFFLEKADPVTKNLDASLVEVDNPDATPLPFGWHPLSGGRVRTANEVEAAASAFRRGKSYRRSVDGGPVEFRVQHCFEGLFPLETVGDLKNVIEVLSETPGAFEHGSSGSPWVLIGPGGAEQLFAQQIAADEDSGFTRGYGQLISGSLETWVREYLEDGSFGIRPGTVRVAGHL